MKKDKTDKFKKHINIYLIRHGMTPGNQEHRYVGRTDEGLTQEARKELEDRRGIFQKVDRVITSSMKRCIQTAEILFPYQVPEIQPGLEEMDFGTFEYRNYKELSGNPQYQAWIDSNGTLPFPAGEDLQQFKQRCCQNFQNSLDKIRKASGKDEITFEVFSSLHHHNEENDKETSVVSEQNKNDNEAVKTCVAFVVHGGTIMSILEAFAEEKKNYYDWQVKNSCGYVASTDYENGAIVLRNLKYIEL